MTPTILFYSTVDPNDRGGLETVLQGIIACCEREGVDNVEVRTRPRRGAAGLASEGESEKDRDHSGPDHLRMHVLPSSRLESFRALRRILAAERPVTVNVHYPTAGSLVFVALRRIFGFRLVLSLHGSDLRLPRKASTRALPVLFRAADAITVVSKEMRDQAVARFGAPPDRIHLIRNGIDATFWTPAPRSVRKRDVVVFIAVGRLAPVKGIDLLLTAFAPIAADHPAASLVLVGHGPDRPALERQAERLGVADRVVFTGHLDHAALRAQLWAADVFVLPSRSEGFPVALLEAMGTGRGFVAASVGGVEEIAIPESGICVPPEDPEALSAAMRQMLAEGRSAECGAAARRRAEAFSRSEAEACYLEILLNSHRYEEAEGRATPPRPSARPSPRRGAGLVRRLRRSPETLLTLGVPPARLGWRWVKQVAPSPAARPADELQPPMEARHPLPSNVARREDLPGDAGWWGYSFRDVPTRRSGPSYMASVMGARVLSYRDGAKRDFTVGILDGAGRSVEFSQVRFRPPHAAMLRDDAPIRRLVRATWFLERCYDNHSHWLTAHLPKLVLLRKRGLFDDLVLPAERNAAIDASLSMLGIDPARHPIYETGTILHAEALSVVVVDRFRPDLLRGVREAIGRISKRPGRRIYISRAKASGRDLSNHDAVWPMLERHGFELVHLEDMDFAAQVRLMGETRALAGPHGAGLTNMMFCASGTDVIEIADPAYPNPNFYAVAAAMGHNYWRIEAHGRGDGHPLKQALEADLSQLRGALSRIGETSPPAAVGRGG